MPRQHRNIFLPFAQRRHGQPHHRQPVIQILPEFARAHGLIQIAIRRRDQPHIDLDGMRPAHSLKFALLQNAQQLHLQRRSQFSNLVQKHHAAIGNFQPAFFLCRRPGERSALVPEQITLQQ